MMMKNYITHCSQFIVLISVFFVIPAFAKSLQEKPNSNLASQKPAPRPEQTEMKCVQVTDKDQSFELVITQLNHPFPQDVEFVASHLITVPKQGTSLVKTDESKKSVRIKHLICDPILSKQAEIPNQPIEKIEPDGWKKKVEFPRKIRCTQKGTKGFLEVSIDKKLFKVHVQGLTQTGNLAAGTLPRNQDFTFERSQCDAYKTPALYFGTELPDE